MCYHICSLYPNGVKPMRVSISGSLRNPNENYEGYIARMSNLITNRKEIGLSGISNPISSRDACRN